MWLWRSRRNSDGDPHGHAALPLGRDGVGAGTIDPRSLEPQGNRESHAVQAFFEHLPPVSGQRILDLGNVSESTARQLSALGHHLHCASVLGGFDAVLRKVPPARGLASQNAADGFLRSRLDFPANTFHAVLAWDVLEHLGEPLLQRTISHLARIVRPGGVMLCFFHLRSAGTEVPVCQFDVISRSVIAIRSSGVRPLPRKFSTREIEALFPQFNAIHLYLMRDALLELLVVR